MTLTFGSVCSGIEAASCAWHPLGWRTAFASEIEPFPRAVLAHRFPETPLHGNFTTIQAGRYRPIDLLVGGTPCQSFSIAGLRGGLADGRGNLALEFLRLANRLRPRWVVWENVPGVLSSNGGGDFGSILGGLVELGYGFAYRVLDAQFFGVAQRRRRVFVVGHLGDWRRAAAVLFERESLSGHPAPRRRQGQDAAGAIARCSFSGGAGGRPEGAAGGHFVAATLTGGNRKDGGYSTDDIPLVAPAVAFALRGREEGALPEVSGDAVSALRAGSGGSSRDYIAQSAVRRLTPRECERLQGFPDDFTLVPWRGGVASDGPRYKALGNSMAVPVMAWIGRRIAQVDALEFMPVAA